MLLPCTHISPCSTTLHFEESIIIGTRAMSGSEAIRLRKMRISSSASSRPSSMLMSSTCAPSSTCLRAMVSASSYFFSLTSRRNLREPATLHRSPMLRKLFSGFTSSRSSPESQSVSDLGGAAGTCGRLPRASSGKWAMCAGVVPQHPPTMFTSPSSIKSLIWTAIFSGVSSYCPNWFGRPALG